MLQKAEKLLFLKGVRQLAVGEVVREAWASKAKLQSKVKPEFGFPSRLQPHASEHRKLVRF